MQKSRLSGDWVMEDQSRVYDFQQLREHGVLWAINRVLFHPRGFALALVPDAETGEFQGWTIVGDGQEVWRFDSEDVEDKHFAAFEQLLRDHRSWTNAPEPVEQAEPLGGR
jgi:hypothetical protein